MSEHASEQKLHRQQQKNKNQFRSIYSNGDINNTIKKQQSSLNQSTVTKPLASLSNHKFKFNKMNMIMNKNKLAGKYQSLIQNSGGDNIILQSGNIQNPPPTIKLMAVPLLKENMAMFDHKNDNSSMQKMSF